MGDWDSAAKYTKPTGSQDFGLCEVLPSVLDPKIRPKESIDADREEKGYIVSGMIE